LSGYQSTLVEVWNGATWKAVAPPNVANVDNWIYGVSCWAAASCLAVGITTGISGEHLLAVNESSGKWTATQPATPSADAAPELVGDSCVATTPTPTCEAVGWYGLNTTSSPFRPLAMQAKGPTWTIQNVPYGSTWSTHLNGVSCLSTTWCKTVGYGPIGSSGLTQNLAETWNGLKWTQDKTPSVGGVYGTSNFNAISCVSTTDCTAVGSFVGSVTSYPYTLAAGWNGSAWAVQSTPNPSGSTDTELWGVSCVAPAGVPCRAAGLRTPSSGAFSLIEGN
jgi:hypothetical protein